MRTLNLALQGGGSHGAFTWGVLDALLADERIQLEGLSGASAGALNAAALAGGYAHALEDGKDPRQGARDSLARVWGQIAEWGRLGGIPARIGALFWGNLTQELAHTNFNPAQWLGWLSPYQANPLDLNPLKQLLEREIDFAAIARQGQLKVFVSATHVRTGKAVIFEGARLTADAVMASACLPMLFQAVEIEGEPYWDGGYSVNPAMTPLIDSCHCDDILLVQINPLRRDAVPRTQAAIIDRVNELTFNASLLTQVRSIDLINRIIAQGGLAETRLKTVRLHRIDGGEALQAWPASTRATADADMIRELFEAGQKSAKGWLARHFDAIGEHGTVDLRRDYLDDTRETLPLRSDTPAERARGFRPWLAALFRRSKRR